MAFGLDDFAKFFDPVSDLLGTSGKQGVGLLQQKPEDIAMAAAAAALMANGIPVEGISLAGAAPEVAAGTTAATTAGADAAAAAAEQAAAQQAAAAAGNGITSAALGPSEVAAMQPGATAGGGGLETVNASLNAGAQPASTGINAASKIPTINETYNPTTLDKALNYGDRALKYAGENPFTTGAGLYYTAYKSGMLDQPKQERIQDNYKNPYSMENFERSSPNPADYQYKAHYAKGGIASVHGYKSGGNTLDALAKFQEMANARQSSPRLEHGDPGIYRDMDPDTAYLPADEAAKVRMSKLNSRANVQAPSLPPTLRMGELNFKPVAPVGAAQGGIMGYSLGGYAAGGNPRLLRGPGDGMSDHIPATINDRQPARLADGEYVITADVVSHLGNGSTEAGAKQLDAMMKRVRKGRTGTPKQGKQIDPRKYLPA